MRGKVAELLMIKSPEIYRRYITVNDIGETMLYFQALNTLYVIIKAAFLFYKKVLGCITYIGFKLNHYDQCVAYI